MRRPSWLVLVLCLGLVALGNACAGGDAVGTHVETYVDTSRPTPPNGGAPARPVRTLRVRFYFPVDAASQHAKALPLVLFSHGVGANPEVYARLLKAIAAAGYVVAAPAFPMSKTDALGGPTPTDILQQPADASFVLTRVLAADRNPSSWLYQMIDPNRVGAAGHSLGALTTYALAYNTCCRDPRIRAAVVLSGATVELSGQMPQFPEDQFFRTGGPPLLAFHGRFDATVAYAAGRSSYEAAHAPKFFVTMLQGNHINDDTGGSSPGERAVERASIDFFNAYLQGDTHALNDLRRVANQPGLTALTAQP